MVDQLFSIVHPSVLPDSEVKDYTTSDKDIVQATLADINVKPWHARPEISRLYSKGDGFEGLYIQPSAKLNNPGVRSSFARIGRTE